MPQQLAVAVENNFTKGLITEATGLNFPENAATDTDNCSYTLVGDVTRRLGIDLEENYVTRDIDRTNVAINTYKWNNAGGDGNTEIIAAQVGTIVYFWKSSSATDSNPVSSQQIVSTIFLPAFAIFGSFDQTLECQFTDGNGYLFIFHPNCSPIYCTYTSGTITGTEIVVQVRDFAGISFSEGSPSYRPSDCTAVHQYNLMNQGWTSGSVWSAAYTNSWVITTGSVIFTVQAGLVGIVPGTAISIQSITSTSGGFGAPIPPGTVVASGTVTSYAGTSLTINVTSVGAYSGGTTTSGAIFPLSSGNIFAFKAATGVYPSNSDVWWYFKNSSGVFDPTTTVNNVTLAQGRAPSGSFIYNAFYINRTNASTLPGLTTIGTIKRPTNGAWFQGRIWFTGVEGSQPATGNASYYTWTENIYFSQVVDDPSDFGKCYQENDPTSENLFDLLPTDGGVITIQGAGTIFKLFPIQNGMLVFAANGIWFITGSQGIGFTANDYTITKISNIHALSGTSFVNVLGLPYFWNEEGIYAVEPAQGGGLEVNSVTVGNIQTFIDDIPLSSKKYVRGSYHPSEYVIQWIYRDEEAESVGNRWSFNRILNYNTYNKAFFPYSVSSDVQNPSINGINFVQGPGGSNTPPSSFKYFCSFPGTVITKFAFADEHDETYLDWRSISPINYSSYFITGYKLRGQAIKKFQPQYIQVYSRTNDEASGYKIQGLWDFSNSGNSGRWSAVQLVTNALSRFDTIFRRHKIRGHGFALQFKIMSVDGMPFDIQGWAVSDTVNQGV